ncbi:hypothetical protein [Clostridium guangxiense]|uniref:hypothetical protein n=1 Tax=Clostridium guangxiense TaxID=1662055 RepID=UPI001E3CEE01|nr:hypothetical protein [Clostridium guangxiense]
MNNKNETTGSLVLLRMGCNFIVTILLTRKQNNDMMILLTRKQNHLLREENSNVEI